MTILASREHLGEPFWHLGSTLGGHFGIRDHPGGPWEQQAGHEVANDRIFVDFGVISGLVSVSFLNSKCGKCLFIFTLVSLSSFYRFPSRIFEVWDLVFALKVLQKMAFHENRF